MIAEPGQHGRGDGADAAGGTADNHRAVLRRQPMLFQREHRKHRGEAGGTDRHRVARRHPHRQAHQPIALDARLLGVSAEMSLTHTPAGADHLVAGLPLRMRRLLDGAREVDACDHREAPHDRRLAGDGKAILVVQRGPFDPHGDVALHQFGFVELRECYGGSFFHLVDPDRLERSQRGLPPETSVSRFSGF